MAEKEDQSGSMDTDAHLTTGDKGRQDKKLLPVKKVQGTGSRSKNSEKYKAKQKIGSSLQAAKKNWRTTQEEKVTEDAMDTEMTEAETPKPNAREEMRTWRQPLLDGYILGGCSQKGGGIRKPTALRTIVEETGASKEGFLDSMAQLFSPAKKATFLQVAQGKITPSQTEKHESPITGAPVRVQEASPEQANQQDAPQAKTKAKAPNHAKDWRQTG